MKPQLTRVMAIVAVLGCRSQPDGSVSSDAEYSVDTVATGLEVPWDMDFAPAPDGRIFVTERTGRIRIVQGDSLRRTPWISLDVVTTGETGLMGIALAPDFASSGHVYVVGTFRSGNGIVNTIFRLTDRDGLGTDPVIVLDNIPAAEFHAGDAIAFGPDGMLYVATGDARKPGSAQDMSSLAGKILRLKPDGSLPADNPWPASPVYALGLRNVQGLAWHPRTRQLFASEHGPSGFPSEGFRRDQDELNVITRGANYGWPVVAGKKNIDRFIAPLIEWTPGIAPSGIAIYSGSELPWLHNILVAALKGEHLRRIVLDETDSTAHVWRVVREERLLDGAFGRLRAVAAGPDGRIYFTTSNRDGRGDPRRDDDMLLRIVRKR